MKNVLLACVSILVLALALPAIAANPEVPADGLKMNKSGKKEVIFNHSSHKDLKCGQCHHKVKDEETFKKCGDAGCHDSMDRKDKSEKGYYNAMHGKDLKHTNCVTCHRQIAEKAPDKKKDLTACKGSKCHP